MFLGARLINQTRSYEHDTDVTWGRRRPKAGLLPSFDRVSGSGCFFLGGHVGGDPHVGPNIEGRFLEIGRKRSPNVDGRRSLACNGTMVCQCLPNNINQSNSITFRILYKNLKKLIKFKLLMVLSRKYSHLRKMYCSVTGVHETCTVSQQVFTTFIKTVVNI